MVNKYDTSKWIYIPEMDTDYRYVLGTLGRRPIFVVGINPSTARPGELDNTMKSVERIAYGNGFDSFITLNVYAQRATDPNDMHMELNRELHKGNLKAIEYLFENLKEPPVIWAAWGTNINKRGYLKGCLVDLAELAEKYHARWCRVGKVSKDGHPHHPLYLKADSKIEDFDIEVYIEKIQNKKQVNPISRKWENDCLQFNRITNNDLICRDCIFRLEDDVIFGNTSKCEVFPDCKPDRVLNGKKCSEYIKD